MASLIEELVIVLTEETDLYETLIPIAESKGPVVVENDIEKLMSITENEQAIVDQITVLENRRMHIVKNIALVLGKKEEQLKSKDIIEYLAKDPKQQKDLQILHDHLKKTIQRLVQINNRNKSLIQQSLEMIEFNMNFIQSTRMSPGNNNYTRGAISVIDAPNSQTRMFDAKQ